MGYGIFPPYVLDIGAPYGIICVSVLLIHTIICDLLLYYK